MKALVVVDYQNDFIQGIFENPKAKAFDSEIAEMVKDFSKTGIVVVLRDVHFSNYEKTREAKIAPPHCIAGGWGSLVYGKTGDAIAVNPLVRVIQKHSFGCPELPNMLEPFLKYGLDEIVFVGIATDVSILANVIITQAHFQNIKITVKKDLCYSFNEKAHQDGLAAMKQFGINLE